MGKYIPLDALVAEIDNMESSAICEFKSNKSRYDEGVLDTIHRIKSILGTLEVKETNLEKHLKEDIENVFFDLNGVAIKGATHYLTVEDIKDIAKHFFELGLRASNSLTWKDIDLILDITDQIANDDSMEEKLNNMSQEEYCTEVLKRFKAQKGE